MHIGLVIYGRLDYASGGFLYDRLVVEKWRAWGDTVSIISLPWRSFVGGLADNLSEKVYQKLDGQWNILLEDELAFPSLIRANQKLRQKGAFPVVSLVHLLQSTSQNWAQPRAGIYQWAESTYLRNVDGCIYVSKNNRNLAEKKLGAKPLSVVAYPAGDHMPLKITEGEIEKRARRGKTLRITYLGNLIPRKGLHILFNALSEVKDTEWTLIVVGGSEANRQYAQRVQEQAKRPELAGRVIFTGALRSQEVQAVLAESDLMALPSEAEGYAIAYLEAMAHGLPVIATSASGAVELIREGENGFLVAPGDVAAIQRAVRILGKDRDRLVSMSIAARRTYEAHPTWEDTARIIRDFMAAQIESFSAKRGYKE